MQSKVDFIKKKKLFSERRKSMKKKSIRAWAAMLAVAAVLSGCGNGTGGTESTGSASAGTENKAETQQEAKTTEGLTEPGTEPITTQKVTLKVVTALEDPDNNYVIKQMKERLGIDFEWIVLPTDQFKEKLNLMLSSGDTIDLILRPNAAVALMSKSEEYKLAQQGLLTPLNDYIEKSSKYLKEYYEEHPYYYQETTTPDGNIYSIQEHNLAYHVTMPYKMWINVTWLDNLGLEMPTTTEEFYQVLKAFKEQDANGNGDPNDEIPLSTCTGGANVEIDGFIMNAFTQNEPNNTNAKRIRVNDEGKVEASFTDENYREGLRFLNRLYEEGLLYQDAFTQDRKTQTALNESGDAARIGCLPAQHMGYLVASMTDSDRWQEYDAMTPLQGPDGVQLSPKVNAANLVFAPNGLIPAAAEHPEVAFRLLDMMFSEEWAYMAQFGEKNVDWRPAVEGEYGKDGKQALITALGTSETRKNKTLGDNIPKIEIPHTGQTCAQDPKAPDAAGHEYILYHATDRMAPYANEEKNSLPLFYYLPEENEKIATYAVTIDSYVTESIARFVTGDLDLDKDWDGYLKDLESYGLSDYLETIQGGYDRWVANAVD